MTDRYVVVYAGSLQPGVALEQAVEAFAARFSVHPQRVRKMLEVGGEVDIKSGLSAREAVEHKKALERIGLTVRIDPPLDEQAAVDSPAYLLDGQGGGPEIPLHELHQPGRVPASHGWLWLKRGFSMVFAYPVHWVGALLIWTVINFALSLVPVAGLLSALAAAVLMGGVMLGAHEQHNGQGFRIERLFAGFSDRLGPLLLVGALYMVGFIVIGLVMLATLGGLFSMAPVVWSKPGTGLPPGMLWSPVTWLPLALLFVLTAALMMAYWFAPVLVMLGGVPPLKAMALSLRGCLRNIPAFIVYTLIALVLLLLGAIPLMLGLLIVVPVLVASVYAAYRDVFG